MEYSTKLLPDLGERLKSFLQVLLVPAEIYFSYYLPLRIQINLEMTSDK